MRLYILKLQWSGNLMPQEMKIAWEIKIIFSLACMERRKCNRVDCRKRASQWISWTK
jgi:hypothetical protein